MTLRLTYYEGLMTQSGDIQKRFLCFAGCRRFARLLSLSGNQVIFDAYFY
jgi:hypothetical protein